jgi:hypothetical protein
MLINIKKQKVKYMHVCMYDGLCVFPYAGLGLDIGSFLGE